MSIKTTDNRKIIPFPVSVSIPVPAKEKKYQYQLATGLEMRRRVILDNINEFRARLDAFERRVILDEDPEIAFADVDAHVRHTKLAMEFARQFVIECISTVDDHSPLDEITVQNV